MPTFRRLTLAALAAALVAAATPAAAGCRLAHNHACARPGASCRGDGRRGVCETTHPVGRPERSDCVCAVPIGHGGRPSHRK